MSGRVVTALLKVPCAPRAPCRCGAWACVRAEPEAGAIERKLTPVASTVGVYAARFQSRLACAVCGTVCSVTETPAPLPFEQQQRVAKAKAALGDGEDGARCDCDACACSEVDEGERGGDSSDA
jgi:hypothetical protein